MKQNLHYFFSILLTIILLSPPAAVWADDAPDYLTFTAVNNVNAKLCLYYNGNTGTGNISGSSTQAHQKIYYTLTPNNEDSWALLPLSYANGNQAVEIPAGSTMYVRGLCTTGINWVADNAKHYHFRVTAGYVEIGGDLMSLIDYRTKVTTVPCAYCFFRLFYSNEGSYTYNKSRIVSAKDLKLSATTLTNDCYQRLFQACAGLEYGPDLSTATNVPAEAFYCAFSGCTALKEVPNLPDVTSIGDRAYYQMFYGCSSLESTPDINATSVGQSACNGMFQSCTRLESLGKLHIETVGNNGCQSMFQGCTHLNQIPDIDMTEVGISGCRQMFKGCTGLRDCSSAHLKATNIGNWAYWYMFGECSSSTSGITHAPQIDATTMGKGACDSMFYNCSTLVYPPQAILPLSLPSPACKNMFTFCTKLTKFPVIKATTLSASSLTQFYYSYQSKVYYGDVSEIEVRFTSWVSNATTKWVGSVASTDNCTFYCSSSLPNTRGVDNIPSNWTIKYYPIVTFSVATDRNGNPTGGTWLDDTYANITGDWYGDEPFPEAKHASKVFRGWVDADSNKITPASAAVARAYPANVITLYAVFANTVTFTFKVSTNGGEWGTPTGSNDSTVSSSDLSVAPTAQKTGYRFIGWNTNSAATTNGLDMENLPTESTTYHAIFAPLCTFDVNTNGGTWSDESTANRAWLKSELVADPTELTTPIKANYHFIGWNTDENATTDILGDDMNNLSGSATTYYAIFTPEYTFAPNGGTWSDETTSNKVFYGSFEVPTLSRNGYTFNGWSPTFNPSSLSSTPTTYTAQWTAINYTFDVATNGGTWSDASTADSVRTVSGITALTTPQKDKFTFERWNTSADGTGTDMDASALPTTATKYYAIFIKVDYFRFIAQNATTISTTKYGSETAPSLSYSTDNGATWNTFTIGTTSVVLAAGDSVCFRGVNANGLNRNCKGDSFKKQPASPYWYFTSTDSVSVAGNIMTLVQGTNPTNTIPAYNCFAAIMKGMPLVSAAKLQLPSSTHNGCYKYMFYNSSIRIAPELPALHVADSAYQGMFSNCQSLKIAPEIPATTVGVASMRNMFYDCWKLTQAPSELKATQIYAYTYRGMFWTCKKLQTSPVIRATTMPTPGNSDVAAMGLMFRNCSTLVNVSVRMKTWNYVSSELSAAYYWLSYGSSTGTLTCPSALPTATRNNQTFPSGWTVNYIPELTFDVNTNGGTWTDESTAARVLEPETTWTIPTDVTAPANRTFVGWNTEADGTGEWLTVDNQPVISTDAVIRTYYAIYAMNLTFNVASVGATWDGSANENRTYTDVQFRRGEIPSPLRGEDEVRTAWVTAGGDTLKANSVLTPNTVYTPRFAEYLCITAQVDNVNVGISSINGTIPFNLYYSTDGMNWTNANASTAFVTLNENQKVYLRGTNASGINNATNYPSNRYVKFNVTNNAIVSGNIMYLIHPTNPPTTIPNTHCFAKLFKHDSNNSIRYCKITDASRLKLPATTLTASCYEGLFHDCNVLVNGPKLTATNLAADCYKWLFYGCSALRRIEVAFDDWSDDGSGNPAYTFQWMYGTTTDANANARFIGPAVLFEHVRNNGHIQTNWKGMDFELLDDQADSYYTDLKDMEGLALQQVTFKGTFPAKRWITFNVPFDFFIPEDHPFANHVYQFLGADGNATEGFDIHFQGGVYELEAGMPYLYYGDETLTDFVFAADGENNTILTIDADALEAESVWPTNPEINTSGAEYRSTVKMTSLPGGDKHYIYLSRNSLYYPHALGNTLYAFSGYFYVPSTGSIAPRVRMMVNGQETSVEIEEFGADSQAAEAGIKKYIQDGVMVIERNGVKYDAQGHKLN